MLSFPTFQRGGNVFAGVTSGPTEVFLNAPEAAFEEYPVFFEVTEIEAAYAALAPKVRIVMPLEKKWYGMTEFAFLDPDGYVITYAQRT